jgi:hypothetical protein
MDMNMWKILIGVALILVLSSAAGAALAQPPEEMQPPPPLPPMLGLSGICGDKEHLYVMAGRKIMQYEITELKLLQTVDLPELPPPPSTPPKGMASGQFPPPPHIAGPHGLWAGDGVLYVLAGPVIYRYSTPDLTRQTAVELPKPEFPVVGN